MIYSRWKPDTGGYDYFETDERVGLADDLPVPTSPSGTDIGIPLTEAGRNPRGALRQAGSGAMARGVIMPLSRSGLGDAQVSVNFSSTIVFLLGIAAGYWIKGRWR